MEVNECQLHQGKKIKFICLSVHKCLRRLCYNCWEEHQLHYPKFEYQTIKKFLNKQIQVFSILHDENDWQTFYIETINYINSFQNLIRKDYQLDLIQSLGFLRTNFKELDSKHRNLKSKLKQQNIQQFTYQEIQDLININFIEQLSRINQFKRMCLDQIKFSLNLLLKKLQQSDIDYKIRKNFKTEQKQSDGTVLFGNKFFEMMHGQYYYKLSKQQIVYGGMYQFNYKVGYWKEFEHNFLSEGEYKFGNRVGEWKFILKNELIANCQYNSDGQKEGEWKDIIIKRYSKRSIAGKEMIFFKGNYKLGKRIGYWKIIYESRFPSNLETIGGGNYDQNERKIGNWKEIYENEFSSNKQVILEGKYENGVKVGFWKIHYRGMEEKIEHIGGGFYNEFGQKTGIWNDINEKEYGWPEHTRCLYSGRYNCGVKVGEWKILKKYEFGFYQIGEGSYNMHGQKIGLWNICKEFSLQKGQYSNGKRVGKWVINTGGGQYDQNGSKIGMWKEQGQLTDTKIVEQGCYTQGGIRFGEWKIICETSQIFSIPFSDQQMQTLLIASGGGYYDHCGQKIGIWKEIDEELYGQQKFFFHQGQYQEGLKVGEWKVLYMNPEQQNFIQIGGGKYDQNGLKTDIWRDAIELDPNKYLKVFQIIWEGNYSKGIKIGEWRLLCKQQIDQNFQNIGGGYYDKNGLKKGKWKEIPEKYLNNWQQLVFEGDYEKGMRVGQWKIFYKDQYRSQTLEIGGGHYDFNGQKIGRWRKVKIQVNQEGQLLKEGEYQKGLKVGEWKIYLKHDSELELQYQGGGKFDQQGQKYGRWKEISNLNIQEGQYHQGVKVGEWELYRKGSDQKGGGMYDSFGQLQGKWKNIKISIFQQPLNKQ